MTTKEKVIRKAIAQATKKLEATKAIIFAAPLIRIMEIRREASEIMQQHGDDNATIARLIKPLGEEERRMFALGKKQENTAALIDKQVALEMELMELGRELYFVERAKEKPHQGRKGDTMEIKEVEG